MSSFTFDPNLIDTILVSNLEVDGNIYVSGKLIVNNKIYKEREDFIKQVKNGIVPHVNGDLYIVSDIIECTEEFMEETELIINRKDRWDFPPNAISFNSKLMVLTGKIIRFENIFVFSDDMFFKLMNNKIEKIKTNIKKTTDK